MKHHLCGRASLRIDWKPPQALAGCGKDGVGHCRDDSRSSRLADSARWILTLNDVNFDSRRLIDTQHFVSVEIGLLHTSIFEGDLAIERCRKAEHNSALYLCAHGIGIDNSAAIDCAHDAAHTHRSIPRYFDFSNLRHIGGEGVLDRDAAADSFG